MLARPTSPASAGTMSQSSASRGWREVRRVWKRRMTARMERMKKGMMEPRREGMEGVSKKPGIVNDRCWMDLGKMWMSK